MMQRFKTSVLLAVPAMIGGSRISPAQASFPLELTNARIVGENAEIGVLLEASIARDGSLVVIDWANQQLLSFTSRGELQWRSGRRGGGPGEFQQLYRAVPLADGSILTYDLAKAGFTRFNAEGKYRDVVRLDVAFHDIASIIGLRDGGVAVAGFAVAGSRADTNASIHVFDRDFHFARSFGPLPAVMDRRVLQGWGVGSLTLALDGSLVFTRRHPYEIYNFTPEGLQRNVIRSTLPISGTPDQSLIVTTTGARTTTRANPNVTLLRPAIMLSDGKYLCGRINPGETTLDLFAPDGRVLGVRAAPSEWNGAIKYDAVRNILWAFGTHADAPILLQYSPSIRNPIH